MDTDMPRWRTDAARAASSHGNRSFSPHGQKRTGSWRPSGYLDGIRWRVLRGERACYVCVAHAPAHADDDAGTMSLRRRSRSASVPATQTYPEKTMATTAHDHDQIDPVRWKSDGDGSGGGGGRKVASMDGYNTLGQEASSPAGHSSFAEWSSETRTSRAPPAGPPDMSFAAIAPPHRLAFLDLKPMRPCVRPTILVPLADTATDRRRRATRGTVLSIKENHHFALVEPSWKAGWITPGTRGRASICILERETRLTERMLLCKQMRLDEKEGPRNGWNRMRTHR
ncbi:hypothetical protein B0H14DRAFT_2614944 [Mycena olivaceomarginata]|nr:hypothetical protein B0H14DRAFT_2614944 [Mycena olivaceomarginata]